MKLSNYLSGFPLNVILVGVVVAYRRTTLLMFIISEIVLHPLHKLSFSDCMVHSLWTTRAVSLLKKRNSLISSSTASLKDVSVNNHVFFEYVKNATEYGTKTEMVRMQTIITIRRRSFHYNFLFN